MMLKNASVSCVPSRQYVYLRDLVHELVRREIKVQYKSSCLGAAWSMVNPLLQLLIFSFLFRVVLPLGIDNYPAFLFSGLLAWTWFQLSMIQATAAITSHRELIKRPGFPAAILPVITVATNMVHFILALPLLFVFILLTGGEIHLTALALPVLMLVQFVLVLSLAYFLATLNVLFRDTQHIISVLLQLLFFMTPIFYSGSRFPEKYRPLLDLNPMVHLVNAYRDILLHGRLPNGMAVCILMAAGLGLLGAGYFTFVRVRDRFVEEL
jgi:lipopolysaccharide transport system permease protein